MSEQAKPEPPLRTILLVILVVLPLAVILLQWALDLPVHMGQIGNSLYKFAFVIPPVIYCLVYNESIKSEIFKLQNWRNGIKLSVGLGFLAIGIFWTLYYLLADRLLPKETLEKIAENIDSQFGVTRENIWYRAPYTILINSMLEEFFYRGFAFGQLLKKNRLIGYLLPASVFTVQHVLFFNQWEMEWLPFVLAVVGLIFFALVLQWVYAKTNTLIAPWLIHAFGDIAMMGIAVILLFK